MVSIANGMYSRGEKESVGGWDDRVAAGASAFLSTTHPLKLRLQQHSLKRVGSAAAPRPRTVPLPFPKTIKPIGIHGGVDHGGIDIGMAHVSLDGAGVDAFIG